jgi:NitT/TauT family transport system substrate-binding protein
MQLFLACSANTLRRVLLFIYSALLLLFLTACRDHDAPAKSETKSDAMIQEDTTTVKIRFLPKWLHQAQFAGVYMANAKGYYRDRGLSVEIQYGGPDHSATTSLRDGFTDITCLSIFHAIRYNEQEKPLVYLAQLFQKNPNMLIGRKRAGLSSLEDIKGKKIGIWGGEYGEHVTLFLKDMDLETESVRVNWSVNLLLSNAIDLSNVMTYNEYHRVLMAGLDPDELFIVPFRDIGYDMVDDGLVTTREFYENNPQACLDFTAATMQGWLYAFEHPEEALDETLRIMRQYHLPANRNHQAWMLEVIKDLVLDHPEGIGVLSRNDYDKVCDLMEKHKVIRNRIDYERFYPFAQGKK